MRSLFKFTFLLLACIAGVNSNVSEDQIGKVIKSKFEKINLERRLKQSFIF